jgi:hypothetical protein
MWYGVLRHWFVPEEDSDSRFYRRVDGRLDMTSLLVMMGYYHVPSIRDFYLVMPDITAEEWNSYYKSK